MSQHDLTLTRVPVACVTTRFGLNFGYQERDCVCSVGQTDLLLLNRVYARDRGCPCVGSGVCVGIKRITWHQCGLRLQSNAVVLSGCFSITRVSSASPSLVSLLEVWVLTWWC